MLADDHALGDAAIMPYGPPEAGVAIVAAFDPVEVEYAAIRRHAAVFDNSTRATLSVTGKERLTFLNRMLTQELDPAPKPKSGLPSFTPMQSRRSFWLSRKGRIDADLKVINLPDRILLDLDIHAESRTKSGLESYVVSEDVTIVDQTMLWHRLSLHGPAATAVLAARVDPSNASDVSAVLSIQPGQVVDVEIRTGSGPARAIIDRHDIAGEIGLDLLIESSRARDVYAAISTSWALREPHMPAAPQTELARRIGWHALNIARIETGTPLYYADFGPDSLPAESGVLDDRVSFKKGCYLGQEVVARMNALGHPKQRLVAMRIAGDRSLQQAETGTLVLSAESPELDPAAVVGAVTSSCISPMLSQAPICLAMVKWAHSNPGTQLWLAPNQTARLLATIQPQLASFRRS